MSTKKFVIRNQNAEGIWETLYPRTTAEQVITNATQRFVTDEQIAEFSAKASTDVATQLTDGLMSAADKAAVDAIGSNIAAGVTEAKDYADSQIAALVDAAPEQMNTLRELAEAITAHEDEYQGLLQVVGEKATKTQLTDGLALKVDLDVYEAAIALKANATDVEQQIAEAVAATTTTVVGATEPVGSKPGDFWFEIVE